MRYIKFHWKLFVPILACVLLLCTTFFKPPRKPLEDIALELESEQFICEDGTIWQLLGEEGYTSYVPVRKIGEIAPETILHEFGNRTDGPIGAVEYAQRVSSYGMVWVDGNGKAWEPSRDGSNMTNDGVEIINLVPFLGLSEVEAELSLELPVEIKLSDRPTFEIPLDGEDEYESCWFTLSLLLEDGWQVVEKCDSRLGKESVKTGTAVYTFDNGNTTTYPVIETRYYYYGYLTGFGFRDSMTKVPGRYLLKVYAEQGEETVQLAQLEMNTKIRGSTLSINWKNETAAG